MNILGIDVSKSSISACLITKKPADVRRFYYKYKFKKLTADAFGVKEILNLKADAAILEPTGTNYSKIWVQVLNSCGVKIYLVGHKELKNYRTYHLNLPDKDDDADALALACYFFDYGKQPFRFVTVREPIISRIRELILRLNHLNRVQSPIINRIRQDLAWQFPEVALVKSRCSAKGDVPVLWGWLCGQRKSKRYDSLYLNSIGLGLSNTVYLHAERLCSLQKEEWQVEREIEHLLSNDQFTKYRKVFNYFGFGMRVQTMILSQIYPLENFLGKDGKPIIEVSEGRNSHKPSKRHISQRKFQKMLGFAPTQESSGDSQKSRVTGGNDSTRIAVWLWVFTRIEVKRNRVKNEIGKQLGTQLDREKEAGRPVRLVRARIAAKAVKLLFKYLVDEICKSLE
ncbi:MAG: transposase [Cyanobacteria bacterium P01_D01_bin.50]